jgi:hypothetical protein
VLEGARATLPLVLDRELVLIGLTMMISAAAFGLATPLSPESGLVLR